MPVTPGFTRYLEAPELEKLAQQVAALRKMERVLQGLIPASLAPYTAVQSLKAGKLHLACSSPAHAAKLRQLSTRIKDGFTARGFEVTAIQVETQASGLPAATERQAEATRPMPAAAEQAFNRLAADMPESELRQSILRLTRPRNG